MEKINSLLKEKIKSQIIDSLMHSEKSFSQLLTETNISDHGQLNYHLKKLSEENLIQKNNQKYSVTPLGERMGVYIKQFTLKEIYPLTTVVSVIQNKKGEILMLRRAKQPQKGKWAFPGGKLQAGETIQQAAERETLEEIGIKIKFDKVIGYFPSLVYKKENLSFHTNLVPVLATIEEDSEITIEKEHDKYEFVGLSKIKDYNLIPSNAEILNNLRKKEFVFKEIITKE